MSVLSNSDILLNHPALNDTHSCRGLNLDQDLADELGMTLDELMNAAQKLADNGDIKYITYGDIYKV